MTGRWESYTLGQDCKRGCKWFLIGIQESHLTAYCIPAILLICPKEDIWMPLQARLLYQLGLLSGCVSSHCLLLGHIWLRTNQT